MIKKLLLSTSILSMIVIPNISNAEGFANDGTIKYNHYDGDGLNNLWVFGDSMSDQSMNKLSGNTGGSVWNGRNANGEVWVGWLNKMSRIRTDERKNFAVSGAKTDEDLASSPLTSNGNPWGKKWHKMGIKTQIDMAKKNGLRFGKNDLVALWGAGNDYFKFIETYTVIGAGNDKLNDGTINTATTTIVNNIGEHLDTLKSMNAKNILVPNWVNMTKIPAVLGSTKSRSDLTQWQAKSDKFWNDYRTKLQTKLKKFSADNKDTTIYYVDIMKGYNYLVKNSELWGIPKANINTPCYTALQNAGTLKTGADLNKNDCSKYVSWDGTHPTSEVQKIIATGFNSVLQIPRLNTMRVLNINGQNQSLLDLTTPSISAIANNDSKQFTINSSAFNGEIGRAKTDPTDGIMQSTSDKYSISGQYRLSENVGMSVGYIYNKTKTNEYNSHQFKDSTTVISLYGVNKINNDSYISSQGYFGYTHTPEIKRMVMLNKIAMAGKTKAHTFGGNVTYNEELSKYTTAYAGINHIKTKIKGYRETTGLETGLGVEIGDINSNRTYLSTGIRVQPNTGDKYQFGWNLGLEYDIKNKIDKYSFKSIDGNVPTNIKEKDIKRYAVAFGADTKINISDMENIKLFTNGRWDKKYCSYAIGASYNIKF